jgi:hypothetical protein
VRSRDLAQDGGSETLPRELRAKLASALADVEVVARLTQQAASINAETLKRLTTEAIRAIEDVNRQLARSSLTEDQRTRLRGGIEEMLAYHREILAACRAHGVARIEAAALPRPPRAWGTVDDFLDGLSLGGWERYKQRERGDGIVSDFVDGLLLRPKRRT